MVKEENEDRLLELVGAVIKDCINDLKINIDVFQNNNARRVYDYYSALAFFKDKESYFKLTNIDFEYLVNKSIRDKSVRKKVLKHYKEQPISTTEEGFSVISFKGIENYLFTRKDERIYSVLLWYLRRAKVYHNEYYEMKKTFDKEVNYSKYLEVKLGQKEYNIRRMRRAIENLKEENKELKEKLKK